jgi:methyltransferase (TIGR00027 family)
VEPDRASWSARIAAYTRAYHYAHDSPRVFEDFLAGTLITPEEREIIESNWLTELVRVSPELAKVGDRATALAQGWHTRVGPPVVVGRARYNEDKLSDAISKGISQYVIVGAGLDTFALRRPDLWNRLRVLELDHPLTQALKRDRLVQAVLAVPPNLHFCPTDFEREGVASSLSRSPYDAGIPTFFSWLGVTIYLTREAISNTLKSIKTVAAPAVKSSWTTPTRPCSFQRTSRPRCGPSSTGLRALASPSSPVSTSARWPKSSQLSDSSSWRTWTTRGKKHATLRGELMGSGPSSSTTSCMPAYSGSARAMTAKALGFTIPPAVLARADEVISDPANRLDAAADASDS